VAQITPTRAPVALTLVIAVSGVAIWMMWPRSAAVAVGSKSFTESVVLGELATVLLRGSGVDAEHRRELGGTRVLFDALEHGDIDVYAEYTGTLVQEILGDRELSSYEQIAAALSERGIGTTRPLGFDNRYAIGMLPETADRLGIRTISDLRDHPGLRLGLSNEFLDRGDGWPSLRQHYGLPQKQVRGLDHDIAYRALDGGEIDAMDLYTTDAEISYYGIRALEDDLAFFPSYEAVFLYRADLERRMPEAAAALRRAEDTLDETRISHMNARVKLDGRPEAAVASIFAAERLGVEVEVRETGTVERLWMRTKEHLLLVGAAMLAGIVVAIPLGVVAAKYPRAGQAVLAVVGVVQTIPALALLVFMIPLLGIYEPPAIAALCLYSLLPMVRNTTTGLAGIPPSLEESAEALGLSPTSRLLRIELPLASPSILAGIKTSTVITIGFATLGALIGAGGYGQPIFTGIRLDDFGLILEGAMPAALLALAAQAAFDVAERFLVPRGLRLRRTV
jgi:osmoprotectant transport system permease protein